MRKILNKEKIQVILIKSSLPLIYFQLILNHWLISLNVLISYNNKLKEGEEFEEQSENNGAEEYDEDEEENEEEEEEEEYKKPLKNKTLNNNRLIKNKEINKELSSEKSNNAKKGKSIMVQKQIFDMIIGLRIAMQKIFKNSNSFNYEKYSKYITEIFANKEEKKIKIAIHSLKSLYDILISYIYLIEALCGKGNLYNQKNLDISAISQIGKEIEGELDRLNSFKPKSNINDQEHQGLALSSKNINNKNDYLVYIENSILKTYRNIELIFQNISKLYYAVFNIWHKKTLAYDSNNRKQRFGENLNLFNFSENITKYLDLNFKKILLKYKINNNDNYQNKQNNDIQNLNSQNAVYQYQDDEFYNSLLKDIISEKDENSIENTYNNDSRYDYTYNYLLNRSQKTKNKNVDTKASKNRKLRFEAHEKIINFMIPVENLNIHVGRDAFIKSIFGLNKNQFITEQYKSKVEELALNENNNDFDEDDIDII